MGNRKQELIAVLQKDLSSTELATFYNRHHIIFERVDLFRDFIISLTKLISNTYLGDDITSPEKQLSHFKWCWNKNLKNFAAENIKFQSKGDHYRYFMKYFVEMFYEKEDKDVQTGLIIQFWTQIMGYLPPRRHIDLGIFIGYYNLMNKNLAIE